MTVDRIITAMAGAFIVISLILAVKVNINFLWFTGFVGLNLFQSAFTGFCLPAILLTKLGVPTRATEGQS